mmetsp:Transcript_21367/g.33062  ORF Transcript_21367/g.33062 Transcript_21367/m.33062 type:complete len:83 (+) Transcript_21367:3620-3868(+)
MSNHLVYLSRVNLPLAKDYTSALMESSPAPFKVSISNLVNSLSTKPVPSGSQIGIEIYSQGDITNSVPSMPVTFAQGVSIVN